MGNSLKKLYETNPDFKAYVDAYMRNKDVTLEEVLEEKLVQEVGKMYEEEHK